MRRRFRRTRRGQIIAREVGVAILTIAALFMLIKTVRFNANNNVEPYGGSADPSQQVSAYWPSRGDNGEFDRREAVKEQNPEIQPVMINVYLDSEKKTVPMNLEEYIYGVVAMEMPATYEREALRAQAVAARTYALYGVEHGGCSKGADVCASSSHCQAYATEDELKKRWGSGYTEYSGKIREAVESTRGEIAAYNGAPINALFHAISGGQTEDALAVFNMSLPYLKSVVSSGEESSPNYKQSFAFSRNEFAALVNSKYAKANVSPSLLDTQIEIKERLASGRVAAVALGNVTVTGAEFRKIAGIASANFTLSFSAKEMVVNTTGYGHGVGMSQVGANAMAQNGYSYQEILTHYYTGIQLQQYER